MGTEGPIEKRYEMQMRNLAQGIDSILNGDDPTKTKELGFALLIFPFGETPSSDRINYLSNGRREDMICALKELVARFEGRHVEETQTKVSEEIQ